MRSGSSSGFLRKLVIAVGVGMTALALIWRKLNPKTPLHYPLPQITPLPLTPACEGGDANPTEPAVEGPVYVPNTPERQVIRDATSVGTPLTIHGRVLTPSRQPIAGAVLDFWNCDANGAYDMKGFRLRGHQYTDATGAYRLETIKPRDYHMLGFHRTPHVHVKVQARETRLLTTQLFFPGEALNEQDPFMKDSLIMDVKKSPDGSLVASFDFVLSIGQRAGEEEC